MKSKTRYFKYAWHVLTGLGYMLTVVLILSVASTKFETMLLAALVQIYAVLLYNFSVIATIIDTNNYAAFYRFRVLAGAQGVTEDEDGTFEEQAKNYANLMSTVRVQIMIDRIANALVSLYALFKIVQAIFFI